MNFTRNVLVSFLIVSFILGGLAGGIFGVYAVNKPQVSQWILKNIFNQQPTASSGSILGNGTIQVQEDSATVDVVAQASPAVVSIVVKQDVSRLFNLSSPLDQLFNTPQQNLPEGKQQVGAGSGFIISSDGLILTNKHVVSSGSGNADSTEYTVVLNDGKQYDAKVLDTDPFNDLALVKIDATGLPTLKLGDSDSLQIGQTVIAIGNALGQFSNTVTKGVVSGLARTITAGDSTGSAETLEGIVQTDAAINFGNSGGPLLNLAGQVVGVNTAISQQGQLIGFTIPINQAKKVIDSVQKYGKIVRPYLGVRYVLINETVAKENKLSVNYGALVLRGQDSTQLAVIPGSPADKAGIVENDIILEINGQKIDTDNSLAKLIQQFSPGDTVKLKILHDGQGKEVQATLTEFTE